MIADREMSDLVTGRRAKIQHCSTINGLTMQFLEGTRRDDGLSKWVIDLGVGGFFLKLPGRRKLQSLAHKFLGMQLNELRFGNSRERSWCEFYLPAGTSQNDRYAFLANVWLNSKVTDKRSGY